MKFTLLLWMNCIKPNCGLPFQETYAEHFEAKTLEEAKNIGRELFRKTKTSRDAWHFVTSANLFPSSEHGSNWRCVFNWPDKVQTIQEIQGLI